MSAHAVPKEWDLVEALVKQPGLAIVPGGHDELVIAGELQVVAAGADASLIEDSYSIEMRIPRSFPARGTPRVFETSGRIPRNYHRLDDRSLCLGAPTRLRLLALSSPRILDFIDKAVIPYLYSRSYFERYGEMPFGELDHGARGLAKDLVAMLRMPEETDVSRLLVSLSTRRRLANKRPCPCKSGRRLGRCHNISVNATRKTLGRRWFAAQKVHIVGQSN